MAYNTYRFLENTLGKFHFDRCNDLEVKFWGLVLGVGIGVKGGRGLKGTWHRTLPGFLGTPMPRISLIGVTIGNMIFITLELGVGVEVWCYGLGVGG